MTNPECIIYHNPRCSKSREALEILQKNNLNPTVIHYLQTPPSVTELQALVNKLKLPVRDVLRKKEEVYKVLGLDDPKFKDEMILSLIHQYPIILERPIVVIGNQAVIARPAERVLGLLKKIS